VQGSSPIACLLKENPFCLISAELGKKESMFMKSDRKPKRICSVSKLGRAKGSKKRAAWELGCVVLVLMVGWGGGYAMAGITTRL
jgi:hypothetical protein